MEILIIGGIIVAIFIVVKVVSVFNDNTDLHNRINNLQRNYTEKSNLLEQREKENNAYKKREISQDDWMKKQENIKNAIVIEIESNLHEKEKAYKWLSPLIADAKLILKEKSRDGSELVTSRRSYETMARVDNLIREKKLLLEENIVLKYQLEYIKTLIPEIEDIVEYDEYKDEALEEDSPYKFLTKDEYNNLSDTEKNIRALEYYKNRKKRNWEIGRDFERYIGYRFEQEDCEVEYFGIEKKFNDLGRDLIVRKNNTTKIVQCKYWSKNKIIHEKHIAQLFGTVTKYKIDHHNENNIIGLFISHTILSDEAKNFSNALGIQIRENVELGDYPMIKCKNGRDKEYGFDTKIYHLPMDQQYDATKINTKNGDFYAFTIVEAERKGFRRAYKWHGN